PAGRTLLKPFARPCVRRYRCRRPARKERSVAPAATDTRPLRLAPALGPCEQALRPPVRSMKRYAFCSCWVPGLNERLTCCLPGRQVLAVHLGTMPVAQLTGLGLERHGRE